MAGQRYGEFCPRCKESKPIIYDDRGNPYFNRCEKFVHEKSKIHSEGAKERFLARVLKKH